MKTRYKIIASLVLLFFTVKSHAQTFYYGHDLSYANQMEDCGAVFKEKGVSKDVYKIFADHGTNLVRVRLWHTPSWQNSLTQPSGVKNEYSDLEDVIETIRRSKAEGMKVMLDLHLSDFWADPSSQLIPSAWTAVASNTATLGDSVYNYVSKVLSRLNAESLMPEIVKVGNENNGGILRHTTLNSDYSVSGSVSTDWARHATLYNRAISAIRTVGASSTIQPKVALHYSGLTNLKWWYQNIINKGVTDFDIIGFSYYYAWHEASIATLGTTIKDLKTTFPTKEVMVVETGYLWTTSNYDAMPNIITTPDPAYLPVLPEKQREYMVDFTREVKRAGGIGVIFWEPEWVSTSCVTPWGTGSSHDHVAFFTPGTNNFMENGGGTWPQSPYYTDLTTKKITFKVDMTGVDVTKGAFIYGKCSSNTITRMYSEGNNIYSYVTYCAAGDTGAYYFLNDSNLTARESIPASCTVKYTTDRMYGVGTSDKKFAFKWSSCDTISAASKVTVSFKVDMKGHSTANGVWITGNFTGTNWTFEKMTHIGDSVFKYQVQLSPVETGAYIFLNDDSWDATAHESVPSDCALMWGTHRSYTIGYNDTTIAYKYSSCTPVGYANATFTVDMTDVDTTKGAWITGDLNSWKLQRMKSKGNNLFSLTKLIASGDSGAYYFLNDSSWSANEKVPSDCAPYWGTSRKYKVAYNDTTIGYIWGSCSLVGSTPTKVNVTYKVDMNGVDISKGVFVTGDMNGWKLQRMKSLGNNLYSFTMRQAPAETGAYYFLNDSSWSANEAVPAACALVWGTSRQYIIGTSDITFGYKWASCTPIGYANATFTVDMTDVDVAKGVWVTGALNGWVLQRMTSQGNNLYSYTKMIASGDSGAYYFLNDSSWSANESVPSACALYWGTSRKYKVAHNDTTFGYIWSSCATVGTIAPTKVNVSFKVDMTGVDVTNGVWITGSLTGSNWSFKQMTSIGNNVYEYQTQLAPGDSGAYVFYNDDVWDTNRESVPSECALYWGNHRKYKIGSTDCSYTAYWGTCTPIGEVIKRQATFRVDLAGQSVSKGAWISGRMTSHIPVKMTNLSGTIYEYTAQIAEGDTGSFFFLKDSTIRETVPTACALMSSNRKYQISNKDTLIANKWASCETFTLVDVTFKVDLAGQTITNGAWITGDMVGGKIVRMSLSTETTYAYNCKIASGNVGAYNFLTDSMFLASEHIPTACALMNKGYSRQYSIAQTDTIIGYKWSSCDELRSKVMTFKVDMTGQDVSKGVWLTGAMWGSSWKLVQMKLIGNNVYQYQINTLVPGDSGAYVFRNDSSWSDATRESVPSGCATYWGNHRGYKMGKNDTTYAFQWSSCTPIGEVTTYTATFQLNTKNLRVTKGIWINGDITSGKLTKMKLSSTRLYTWSTKVEANKSGSYYYVLDSIAAQRETVPTSCALVNGTDRKFIIGLRDSSFQTNWASCSFVQPAKVSVTFKVRILGLKYSEKMYINGTVTNDTIQEMPKKDGTYDHYYTTQMWPYDSVSYYYLNDKTETSREQVPSACALWNAKDRKLIIADRDTSVGYQYASCEDFLNVVDATNEISSTNEVLIYPNPCRDGFYVKLSGKSDFERLEIYNISGRLIKSTKLQENETYIDGSNLKPDVYFVKFLNSDNKGEFRKLIVY